MAKKLLCLIFTIFMVTSANSVVIECTWSGETCSLNTGVVITQPNEVITISGKAANYINTVTTNIIFNEKFVVKYIPANIFTIFTNLKWLQLTNTGLTNLVANFSASCPFLERLIIDEGVLQEVPEGFLQTCTNVLLIGLRHNQITTVHKNAFRDLAKLQQLDMTNNKIKCLHADLFQHNPALISAHFYHNRISALDGKLLRNSNKLGLFDIRYNLLTYLPVFNLSSPSTTSMSVYAAKNPIVAINPNFCSSFRLNLVDYFIVGSIGCLSQNQVLYTIDRQNCQTLATILQPCYANWVPTMTDNVLCEQGSGACISSNILSKFSELIKLLRV